MTLAEITKYVGGHIEVGEAEIYHALSVLNGEEDPKYAYELSRVELAKSRTAGDFMQSFVWKVFLYFLHEKIMGPDEDFLTLFDLTGKVPGESHGNLKGISKVHIES